MDKKKTEEEETTTTLTFDSQKELIVERIEEFESRLQCPVENIKFVSYHLHHGSKYHIFFSLMFV